VAWGVPEYAALVAHYVRAHGLAPLPAIGHSNGGRILLHLASDDATADLFSRLVLISPSGVRPARPPSYYLKTAWAKLLKAPFLLLPEGPLRRRGLAWLRTTIFWKLIASSDYQAASGVMREAFVRTVTHHLDDRLARVRVPTLLLWGENDTAVSRRQMAVLEREIPDAGLVVLRSAGHYGYLDAYDAYAAAVQHFLKGRGEGVEEE
jgi:pimeloyl-ACP methyl ester carboxylesterase